MNLSKWSICPMGKLYWEGLLRRSFTGNIVYLEDHSLIRESVVDLCLKPFFSQFDIIEFSDGDQAFEFIKNQVMYHKKVDLFITDINHGGMKGDALVKNVRKLEWMSEVPFRIPIIILSMIEESRFPRLRSEEDIDDYFSKACELEELIERIDNVIYTA